MINVISHRLRNRSGTRSRSSRGMRKAELVLIKDQTDLIQIDKIQGVNIAVQKRMVWSAVSSSKLKTVLATVLDCHIRKLIRSNKG